MQTPKYNIIFEETLPYSLDSELGLIELARKGVTKKAVQKLAALGSLSMKKMAELLPISERTLQRYKDTVRLNKDASEHVIIISRALLKAEAIFNDAEKLKNWLHSPSLALGQRTPLSLLDTSFGAQMVMDELGRMEYGVYS